MAKYTNEQAIEMMLEAWQDEQEESMRKFLRERTRGDLVDSIFFHYNWDEGEYYVHVYPSDESEYHVELPIYKEFSRKELINLIEEAWYSDPEEDTVGGYEFQKN